MKYIKFNKYATIKELDRMNDLKHEIIRDNEKLATIRAKQYGITSKFNCMPGSNRTYESSASRYYPIIERLEADIDKKIQECIREALKLEYYIAEIPDSFTRRIFTLRFAEGLEWRDVAQRIGGGHSAKSVSCICYRFIHDSYTN